MSGAIEEQVQTEATQTDAVGSDGIDRRGF